MRKSKTKKKVTKKICCENCANYKPKIKEYIFGGYNHCILEVVPMGVIFRRKISDGKNEFYLRCSDFDVIISYLTELKEHFNAKNKSNNTN